MARIRSVHPGLFTDEAFVSCSPLARILFIGLWTEADDAGAFEWKPITIKMRLMPVDNADVSLLLEELEAANMVKRYAAGGREYGAVRNFCRYQRPKKPKSVHPMPVEFRTYVASDVSSSEPSGDEDPPSGEPNGPEGKPVPPKSEPDAPQPPPVPKKSRISPQMEDGGWREGEEDSSARPGPTTRRAKALHFSDDDWPEDFRQVADACKSALGEAQPADAAIGPIVLLVQGGTSLQAVTTVLRSEAQRPRQRPIRTWKVWADIVVERLAAQPKLAVVPAEDASNPRIELGGGFSALLNQIRKAHSDGTWPERWGPPIGQPGCRLKPRDLALVLGPESGRAA